MSKGKAAAAVHMDAICMHTVIEATGPYGLCGVLRPPEHVGVGRVTSLQPVLQPVGEFPALGGDPHRLAITSLFLVENMCL